MVIGQFADFKSILFKSSSGVSKLGFKIPSQSDIGELIMYDIFTGRIL